MDTLLMILQIITLVALGYIFKAYLPSYLRKKGENLATKEDIVEITDKIEQVRVQYIAKLEEFKQTINSYYEMQKAFDKLQQDELLKFYDIATEFYYERLAINFGDFPADKGKSLFLYQESFQNNVLNLIKSYQRIVLYFDHENDLRMYAEGVLTYALQARTALKKNFGSVKIASIDEDAAHNLGDKAWYEKTVQLSNEANKKYWEAMKPILSSYQDALRLYLTTLNKFIRPSEEMSFQKKLFKE